MADRDAIRTVMAAGFQGPLKGSRGLHEVQSIRLLVGIPRSCSAKA